MRNRLIIVDGQSTVGKSSISKAVYKQISKEEKCFWLHEECYKHPIRDEEFQAGDLRSVEGMELNRKKMLQKWTCFRDEILKSDEICVTEGCLLHAIDRYLLASIWSEEQITEYFAEIIQILKPLNPLIVFVHRPNIRESFEKAFAARGDWWKNLILGKPEPYGYFERHEYTGDGSIFEQCAYEQQMMSKVFDSIECNKLKLDTSDESWDDYVSTIVDKAGFQYHCNEIKTICLEQYCGIYHQQDGDCQWVISQDLETNQLYTRLFWPYMPMEFVEQDVFELISFPATLTFEQVNGRIQFVVEGNYDWDLNGKHFVREV